jgi:hypothetical protein
MLGENAQFRVKRAYFSSDLWPGDDLRMYVENGA